MSRTAHGLQTLLTCYNDASKRFGLKVNAKKTEAMCLGPESDFGFVYDIKLKNVDRFKYLGSYVNQACNLKTEITARIQATSHAFYSLKQRVFGNNTRPINQRPKLVSISSVCCQSCYTVVKPGHSTQSCLQIEMRGTNK